MKTKPHLKILEIECQRLFNKIPDKQKFIDNILIFCRTVRHIESDDNLSAKNKHSTAKGAYQYLDDSLVTAYNRLDRYFDFERKPIIECNEHEQTAIFLADTFQKKGTDKYLLKIGNDMNIAACKELYSKFHHTKPDLATKNRISKFFY